MARSLLLGLLLAVGTASAQSAPTPACKTITLDATDAVTASPANHTVIYEDADIRVLDVHSQPHTREAVHTHAYPSVMYIDRQGAGTINRPGEPVVTHPTDPNFKPVLRAIKPEGPHWTENTGEVPFHAIRVEFKHPGCGLPGWKPAAPDADDAPIAAPGSHTLLFENADVRVLDVHIAPHATDAYHTHPWPGVLYVIQAAPIQHFAKGSSVGEPRTYPPGVEIVQTKAQGHSTENMGDTPLHMIRFELKFATPGAANAVAQR
jgi:mannose-6-phosphate isomerase-like protein (cupin superfamily)